MNKAKNEWVNEPVNVWWIGEVRLLCIEICLGTVCSIFLYQIELNRKAKKQATIIPILPQALQSKFLSMLKEHLIRHYGMSVNLKNNDIALFLGRTLKTPWRQVGRFSEQRPRVVYPGNKTILELSSEMTFWHGESCFYITFNFKQKGGVL